MRITKRRPRPKGRVLSSLMVLVFLTTILVGSYMGVEEEIALIQSEQDATNGCGLKPPSTTNSTKYCFKVVTYTGGFGNRLGPVLCALGLAEQLQYPLRVLWNSANEGVPGDLKPTTTRATQRPGYNLTDIQQAMEYPFHFIELPKGRCRDDATSKQQPNFTFYPPQMEKGVLEWKEFYRTIDASVVHDYELREQAFDDLDCYNLPTMQGTSKINGYTPEPCFAKYNVYAKTDPDFKYLEPLLVGSKNDYVDALIRATRRIQPTLDLCLPTMPYMVVHARRGDRWPTAPTDIANATPIVRNVLVPVQPLGVMILSDNAAERDIIVNECRRYNIPVVTPACTAQELVNRNVGRVHHAPTMAVIQDYFAMANAVGIVSDFLRSESSFSTTAALGNDIPLLYFGNRSSHAMKRVEERGGGARMRNVYFLEHVEAYVQAVVRLRKNKV